MINRGKLKAGRGSSNQDNADRQQIREKKIDLQSSEDVTPNPIQR